MTQNTRNQCVTNCLFQEEWWLNAVAPDNWNEVTVEQDGKIIGRMAYIKTLRFGKIFLSQPPFTKFLGPWIAPYSGKLANRYSYEKQVIGALIDKLPKFDEAHFELHYDVNDWQPFYWRGFSQTTFYSYVIDDLSDMDLVYSGFRSQKRKDISKARKQIMVTDDFGPINLYNHHRYTLAREGKVISYSSELLMRMYSAAIERNSGLILCAKDDVGRVHASIFVVWDQRSSYYLISSIDPDLRSSGAATLLVWEAIKHCSTRTKCFDFEGSMIEPVANSFRAFGASLNSYSLLSRTDSLFLRIRNALKVIKTHPKK